MRKATIAILEENAIERAQIGGLLRGVPGVTVLDEPDLSTWHIRTSRPPGILLVNVRQARRNKLEFPDAANLNVAIVALADSPEAALEAFNLRAVDCLLKPVQETALRRALQRAFDYLELREPKPASSPRPNRAGREYLRQVRVTKGDAVLFVPAEQIFWIEAQDNYVRIHVNDQVYMERGTISSYESSLDPGQFLRVNRSAIVNVGHVQELRSMFKGAYSVILRNGSKISMSRSIEKLEKRLTSFPPDHATEDQPLFGDFARD